MDKKIYIVGIGPGREDMMTKEAYSVLEQADVIVGYTLYLQLLSEDLRKKELLSTPMRGEKERCRVCFAEAEKGKRVALICSGDAGIYGLASLMYEIGQAYPETELVVVPGVTAACSGAALLGAPLGHDLCIVSLSDLLTPWEKIAARLKAAAEGDFVVVLYNPSSHKRKDFLMRACDILLSVMDKQRPCGYARNIGRDAEKAEICTLWELRNKEADMFTTVFIGNSETTVIGGKLVTRRGYWIERDNE
ncbi:MAG: precorrin-3B C(17)-methyltransferase [Roseburia sp.]|nr:precorrin-3B C(17)-methyltransferase [Roseburia sp.]MCM1241798.1 precorrin-3B C(17)-methyltransferase [Roseburia sp.]